MAVKPLYSSKPKPFLKWAGGKRQLLPELVKHLPKRFNNYFEPFLGGGALFFELYNLGKLNKAYLSDINKELMVTYGCIQLYVDLVINKLKQHKKNHSKEYFYKIREKQINTLKPFEIAARMIYLNKTCFNGLYRVNKKGQFNVPCGKYKNPNICDEENLINVFTALNSCAFLFNKPFEYIVKKENSDIGEVFYANKDDFVYFDPPYYPVSKTANFTTYFKDGFTEQDQQKLYEVFCELNQRGVSVMLSSSDVPWIRERYKDFNQHKVSARRNINSKGNKRKSVGELIITNY